MAVKSFGLTPPLEKILIQAIYPFHLLTAEQVARLLYSPGSLNGVKAHLKKLTEAKYLDRFYLPTGFTLRPYVYMLGSKGKAYFQEEKGWQVPKLPKVSVMQQRSHSFLMHLLEINSVIITAKLIEKYAPSAWLEHFDHDISLKSNPLVATLPRKNITVVPDAVLDVRMRIEQAKTYRRVLWVEVERGTNNDRDILKKLHDIYQVLDSEVFQQRYGTYNVKVCYFSTAGPADVQRLRKLTRKMLEEKRGQEGAHDLNSLFYFIAIPDLKTEVDTAQVFLSPSWEHPYDTLKKSSVIR